jgi:hypothetical protein
MLETLSRKILLVPTGSNRDMFVQELFQKVADELDTLYGELKQLSIGSTYLIPQKPCCSSNGSATTTALSRFLGIKLIIQQNRCNSNPLNIPAAIPSLRASFLAKLIGDEGNLNSIIPYPDGVDSE